MDGSGTRGDWTHIHLPAESRIVFRTRGRVFVIGFLSGYPIVAFALPSGNGTHSLIVNRAMREGAKISPGEWVDVALWRETANPVVRIPTDLRRALSRAPALRPIFEDLTYSTRGDLVLWIQSAKRPETRARRIEVAIARLKKRSPVARDKVRR